MKTMRCCYEGEVDMEEQSIETFVVFYLPSLALVVVVFPRDIFWDGEECLLLFALAALHDGGDELL